MRLLLDTCAFLWLAAQPTRLSPAATMALNDDAHELFVSDVSVWEIVLKHQAGKLPLPESPRAWIPKQVEFFQLRSLPAVTEAIFKSGELPDLHRDPFDRLLAAQAIVGGFQLVSPDRPFRDLGVDCLW